MQMWEYTRATLNELSLLGLEGWEAVGNVAVAVMGTSNPVILLKRPIGPIAPATNQNMNNETEGVSVNQMSSGLYSVMLVAGGNRKIAVIKEVRTLTNLGLREAKDLVDGAPKPVLEKVSKPAADMALAALVTAGATVEICEIRY